MKIQYIALAILAANLACFALYGADKAKAVKNKWRIPEKTLLARSILAPAGGLAGMKIFHHKTRKWYFWRREIFGLCLHLFLIYRLTGGLWG